MAIQSIISSIVANQIGKLQGELEARIQREAFELISKFTNQCPVIEELAKIIKVRNSLLKVVNSFQKKVNRFSSLPSKLQPPIVAAKILILLIENNPLPSAIIPPSGGVGIPIGKIVKQADRLRNAKLLLQSLEDDLKSLRNITAGIQPSIQNTKQILESVNTSIQGCLEEVQARQEISPSSEDQQFLEQIQQLIKEVQPLENTGSEGTPDTDYTYRSVTGKDYTLSIIQDQSKETTVPRRVAVAKDNRGIVVLRGQPSFSSDTQILLDELKFRIDNQLP